jgi:hypothetical protein
MSTEYGQCRLCSAWVLRSSDRLHLTQPCCSCRAELIIYQLASSVHFHVLVIYRRLSPLTSLLTLPPAPSPILMVLLRRLSCYWCAIAAPQSFACAGSYPGATAHSSSRTATLRPSSAQLSSVRPVLATSPLLQALLHPCYYLDFLPATHKLHCTSSVL